MKVNKDKAISVIRNVPKGVKLLVASKYIDVDGIYELENFGYNLFGENIVQDFVKKYENYEGNSSFHFIGTLQTNKVKYIIDKVSLIHSVANYKLIDEIEKQAKKINKVQDILLQVNIAREESKHGFDKEEMNDVLKYCLDKDNIRVVGLMMMAPNIEKEDTKVYFKETRELRDKLKNNFKLEYFNELSMGMSNDYDIAIEEGSTIVRIGKLIFEE